MELNDAILQRRSVRAFLPDPAPRENIERALEVARWAPSWGNTQPWEIVVADGSRAKELADLFVKEATAGRPVRPDITMPIDFPDVHKNRYMKLGKSLFSEMGIERGDKEARQAHYMNMYKFFGAPTVVYFLIDEGLNEPYASLDVGSIGTTFCYTALQEGLSTIFLAASMHYPDIVRKTLEIPETKKVVIGIAVGYAHPDAPAALFRSDRENLDSILRFA